jgi:hypothetical protein
MRKIGAFVITILALHCSQEPAPYEFKIPDYRSWEKPVNRILDYPVPGHGASYRIIFANDVAFGAVVKKDDRGIERVEMPDGSIIIKESYLKRKDISKRKIRDLTIMVKRSNDPKAQNGWLYYVKFPPKKITRVDGKMCIGCHEAANEQHPYFDKNAKNIFRDYLFTPFIY